MIDSGVIKQIYLGDGTTTQFPFSFPFVDADHVKVAIYDTETDTETALTSDYYVDSAASKVLYPGYPPGEEPAESEQPAPLPAGKKLIIYRDTPISQLKDLGEKYPLPIIEEMVDKNTMILQETADKLDRAVVVDKGATQTPKEIIEGLKDKVSQAAASASAAAGSAEKAEKWAEGTDAQVSTLGGTHSAGGWCDISEKWAEGTDAQVTPLGGTHSAKGWAAAAEDEKDDAHIWAEGTDAQVVPLGGTHSAKTWAQTAARVYYVENVAAMRADSSLTVGMVVMTKGYYTANDGGTGTYNIRAAEVGDVDDGGSIIVLDNGNVAERIETPYDTHHDDGAVFRTTNINRTPQDATVYDGKMFYMDTVEGAETGLLKVLDLTTNTVIANNALDGGAKPHGNVICFGKKQSPSDTYPLLYITGYNGEDENGNDLPKGTCFVYKVNDDFTTTFIQKIVIGFTSDDLWTSGYSTTDTTANSEITNTEGTVNYGDYIVDTDNNYLYVATVTTSYPLTRLFKFNLPSTSSALVTLQITDVIEYKNLPIYRWLQGAEYYKDKIYLTHGTSAYSVSDACGVAIIDLKEKTQVGYIPNNNYFIEMEAVFVWNGELYISGAGQSKFIVVETYNKLSNIGDIRALRTRYNTSIVQAINHAKDTAAVLYSMTDTSVCHYTISVRSTLNFFAGYENAEVILNAVPDIVNKLNTARNRGVTYGSFCSFDGLLTGANGTAYFVIKGHYNFGSKTLSFSYHFYTSPYDTCSVQVLNTDNFTNCSFYTSSISIEPSTKYAWICNSAWLKTLRTYEITVLGENYGTFLVHGGCVLDYVLDQVLSRDNLVDVKSYGTKTGVTAVFIEAKKFRLTVTQYARLHISYLSAFSIKDVTP